jgi:hypothetical protein
MMINEAKIKIKGLGYKIAGSSTLTVTVHLASPLFVQSVFSFLHCFLIMSQLG